MSRYYDRAGDPIGLWDWVRLSETDAKIVKQEYVGDYWVSTVWLGLNHNYGNGPPLIFETMVFKGGESDLDCERYSTEQEAVEGHVRMVEKVRLFADTGRSLPGSADDPPVAQVNQP